PSASCSPLSPSLRRPPSLPHGRRPLASSLRASIPSRRPSSRVLQPQRCAQLLRLQSRHQGRRSLGPPYQVCSSHPECPIRRRGPETLGAGPPTDQTKTRSRV